jgi:hypothetical protein
VTDRLKIIGALVMLGVGWFIEQPGQTQSPPSVTLQVVKYSALTDAVVKNRGKVVLIDFWGNF